ncbi:autotransporter family protein [Paraburkholderia solisilvae]|uniref:Autotransporter domain-containing protein n=1 Tax=Paraburkholderia solisilvae TaxID=624376 RepID=A0A6J5EIH2_9BURK|nr:autotransporter outer membrane beta-barrel domain-containing protein [Paraburkholderia solisilvae]CAB3765032.1 hypothetical protein LMG29739_04494 [Paraburkholderia solisilvae]
MSRKPARARATRAAKRIDVIRPHFLHRRRRHVSIAVATLFGAELLAALPVSAQQLIVNNGTQTISANASYNQITVGSSGSGILIVTGSNVLLTGVGANPMIELGNGGTGTLTLTNGGGVFAFGLNIHAGSTFDLSGAGTIPTTTVSGVGLLNLSGTGTINSGNKALVVGVDNSNQNFSGTIVNAGNSWDPNTSPHGTLVKVGNGTLTIDGATIAGAVTNGAAGTGGEVVVAGGTLAQTSGNTRISALTVGVPVPGFGNNGNLAVSGGTLTLDTSLTVGSFTGIGTVTQTNGAVVIQAGCGDVAHCAALTIGNQSGTGTYAISGGALTFNGPGFVILGRTSGTGTLNISGGQMSVNGGSGGNTTFIIGDNSAAGTGTVNQTGGTLTIANNARLYLSGTGNGTYNLSGGVLQIGGNSLTHNYPAGGSAGGTYAFNLGGGTIQVLGTPLTTDVNATLAGGTSTIDTNGLGATWTGVLSGNGALNKTGAGVLTLTATNPYTGATTISGGTLAVGNAPNSSAALSGTSQLTVQSGATLGGYGTVAGNVMNAGTIAVANALPDFQGNGRGSLTLLGDLANSGVVNLDGGTPGNALIVRGNYADAPDATVIVRTVLNEGGPLSNQQTDRLLISGNATGTTTVTINPHGEGGPAIGLTGTPSSTSGISIVQVGGSSASGAFVLGNAGVAGDDPFVYHLAAYGPSAEHGPSAASQADPRGGGNTWDFRLQSTYTTPEGPIDLPPDQPAEPTDPNIRPAVAPQVAAYLTAPLALFQAGMVDISTLHQRLGEIRYSNQSVPGGPPSAGFSLSPAEAFVRAYGGQYRYTTNRSFDAFGFNTDIDTAAVQFGGSVLRRQGDYGVWRYGLAAAFGHVWWTPSAVDGNSKGDANRYTFYGTATFQSNAGWYTDGIIFGGLFDGHVSTDAQGKVSDMGGTTVGLSFEAGYPFQLTSGGLFFEPQAQLVWQHLSFNRETDIDGIDTDLGGQDDVLLRIGFRLAQPLEFDKYPITPYFKFNFLQPLTGDGNVTIGGFPFGTGKQGSAMEVGGGVTGQFTPRFSVFADAVYQHRLVSYGSNGWAANAGLRYVF